MARTVSSNVKSTGIFRRRWKPRPPYPKWIGGPTPTAAPTSVFVATRARLRTVEHFTRRDKKLREHYRAPRPQPYLSPLTQNPHGGAVVSAAAVYGLTITAETVYGLSIAAYVDGEIPVAYDIGDSVRFQGSFLNAAGAPADPTAVTLRVKWPTGAVEVFTYAAAELTKASTGVFYRDITMTHDGVMHQKWEGTGSVIAAEEDLIEIRESAFDLSD